MGEVYRGRDTQLERDVAIKILPADFANDPERVARFEREARTLAALNHPHIAIIHGLENAGGVRALVMELVDGEDLSQRIARGPIPVDEASPIARQIAEALEAAHEQGIIHRDLKPANIKVTADGVVKVLDFGLAKAMDRSGESGGSGRPLATGIHRRDLPDFSVSPTITSPAQLTSVGVILGTAAYMSPEQARGKPVDKCADIWAFGVVLFEMLTGQRLFIGETTSDTMAAVLKSEPDWRALPTHVPTAIHRLLRRCLDKDPKQRLQSIGEARIALSAPLDADLGASVVQRPTWRAFLPWVVATAALLTAAGVSLLHFRETRSALTSIRFQVSPPDTGEFDSFRLSPDGRRLAFVTRVGRQTHLWVRALDSVTATSLAGTDGARYPFWSADSSRIGFFAQGKLKTIAAVGGLAVSVCDAPNGRGGTWNRDDVILFAPDLEGGLYQVPGGGGTPTPVTKVVAGSPDNDRFPEFLSGGLGFVFLRQSDTDGGIHAGTLTGGPIVRLLPDESAATYVLGPALSGFLLFRRDNTLMAQPFDPKRMALAGNALPLAERVHSLANSGFGAFASSEGGTIAYISGVRGGDRQLVWLNRAGTQVGVVSKPDEISDPALSPDDSTVAYAIGIPDEVSDLWLRHLTGDVSYRLTFGPTANAPLWSPDGTAIVFEATLSPSNFLLHRIRVTSGSQAEVLLKGQQYSSLQPSDWSLDGKFIVFTNRAARTKDDLWLLPLEGDRKATPFLQTPFNERAGRFSPDGQWLAYQSDASGRDEVYVQRVPSGGQKAQVTSSGGQLPVWSHDGKELFYLEGGQRLMSVPVTLGAAFDRGPGRLVFDNVHFFVTTISGPPFQISHDGTRFLALVQTAEDAQPAPITVVTNWQTTLPK